jgi:hypothetical protein
MPRPQVSVIKRQREQAKRERQQVKAERRLQRKNAKLSGETTDVIDDIEAPEPDDANA